MPKSKPTDIPHEEWTDHRILRQQGKTEMQAPSLPDAELIPVPGVISHSTERDLGLAYYNLVSGGDVSQSESARKLLENANRSDPKDTKVLTALGVLAELRNDRQQAYRFYRSALVLDSDDYNAALNCGVLLAGSGQLKQAANLWAKTFTRNEDITELGMNLAAARCMLGEKDAAETVLRRVLVYNPDHQRASEELKAMESGAEACTAR